MRGRAWCATIALACSSAAAAQSTSPIVVHDATELARALTSLVAGTTLRIASGEYTGGRSVSGIANLTVEAADPAKAPRFVGGTTAGHFSKCPGRTLRNLSVSGQTGNGINIDDGGESGQGIDLVGCHRVLIDECRLSGKDGFTQSAGVQAKGGSSDVVIEDCRFTDAGARPINAGGSTGLEYFRPKGGDL